MKRRFTRYVLLACPLLLVVAARGQTSYYPANQLTNPGVDLLTYSGKAKSIVVQILNLTPYDIQYTPPAPYSVDGVPVASLKDMVDKNRWLTKSFMFAPVGVPNYLPRVPPEAIVGDPSYRPDYINTVTHPYSMLFAWDDDGGFVSRSSVFWTVKDVKYSVCSPTTGTCTWQIADVPVGLFMSRIAPVVTPKSEFLAVLVGQLKTILSMVKIAKSPLNPLTWYSAFTTEKELANQAEFLARQMAVDEAGKMYVTAYAVPDMTTDCYSKNSTGYTCAPSAAYADDATYAQWSDSLGGPAASDLMVTTHVLRGRMAYETWSTFGDPDDPGRLGWLPIVMITIMTGDQYVAGQSATLAQSDILESDVGALLTPDVRANIEQLRKLLEKHGSAGLDALWSVVRQRTAGERWFLRELVLAMARGNPLSNEQRQAFHRLVVDVRLALNEKEEV